ncbi:hypothetical protein Ddye_001242 [Dipteronia dyeriana]|uniref:Uncharacterized protein n=1 Tax=Dipteronia dyeriana TaxID=168575 RepID=A0AAE0CTT9_9ROSI|nr:hypothetical protein Ddye_001242 [Dipteronia dyeriana]
MDCLTVCKSKAKGGLGIGRMLVKNDGLLAKWVWRFGREETSLWKKAIRGRIIEVVSDSKVAVAWVNDDGFGNVNDVQIIYDIRSSLDVLGSTTVSYSSRDTNQMADGLAKLGSLGSNEVGDFVEWCNEFMQ